MSEKKSKEKKFISGTNVPVSKIVVPTVILVVLMIVTSFVLSAASSDSHSFGGKELQAKLYTQMIVTAMPKSITGKDNGDDIVFYIERNKDYDIEKDAPLEQFRVYYLDDEGKHICPKGEYIAKNSEKMNALIGFFLAGSKNLKVLKGVLKTVLVLIILLILGMLIYVIYLLWSVREDRKYSPTYYEEQKAKKLQKQLKKSKDSDKSSDEINNI